MPRAFAPPQAVQDDREILLVSTPAPVRRTAAPLVVGAADDRAEREADRVAEEVVQRLAGGEKAAPAGGGRHVHDGCHGVARSVAPPSGTPEVGRAGGEISDDLTSRIEARRGKGAALPGDVRRRMETGFGRSLADVRVHVDGEAATLNRSVSARAFTTGKDIFFGAGQYEPGTPAGDHVLAHEIAHTQQGGSSPRRLHRFSAADPDFTKTTRVVVKTGGGSGNVAVFEDGTDKNIIVKVDQGIASEVITAGNLQDALAQKNGSVKGVSVKTPGARVATAAERGAIKKATLAKIDPTTDPRNFVKNVDSPNPTIIMDESAGKSFSAVMKHKHTGLPTKQKKSKVPFFGKRKTVIDAKNSPMAQLMGSQARITALAQQIPGDVVMGMFDRLVGMWNPKNFLWDEDSHTFAFVDNTQNAPGGFLTSGKIFNDWNKKWVDVDYHDAFTSWAMTDHVQNLQDPAKLAGTVLDGWQDAWKRHLPPDTRDDSLFDAEFKRYRPKMESWLKAGIAKGRKNVLDILHDPLPLVAGLDDEKKHEAVTNLCARRMFLNGIDAHNAWRLGVAEADRLAPKPPPKKQHRHVHHRSKASRAKHAAKKAQAAAGAAGAAATSVASQDQTATSGS